MHLYSEEKIYAARKLRKDMTKEEKHLWYDYLRGYSVKFRRQKLLSGFIVDFYCPQAKLVIELDGSGHYTAEQMEYDRQRTVVLNAYGIEVLRFSDIDVNNNFLGVCHVIDEEVRMRMT